MRYVYRYQSANPHGTICDECAADVGRLFEEHERIALPRHQHCYCYYLRIPAGDDPGIDPGDPVYRREKEDEGPTIEDLLTADDAEKTPRRPAPIEREDISGPQLSERSRPDGTRRD